MKRAGVVILLQLSESVFVDQGLLRRENWSKDGGMLSADEVWIVQVSEEARGSRTLQRTEGCWPFDRGGCCERRRLDGV
jgi:dephospho-CoA kinase